MTNLDKSLSSQSYGFSSSQVWMWELYYKENCNSQIPEQTGGHGRQYTFGETDVRSRI